MGYLDWLTTVIGIVYFGAVELNPLFADIARTNLVAFTAIKLTTTIFLGLLCYLGERMLRRLKDKNSRSFLCCRIILTGGYVIAVTFLSITILNNLFVVARIV
jgi:ABC-type Na+ efflux pump permease subunit